jgi:hypothetical protein
LVPNLLFVNRNGLFNRQPNNWPDTKPHDKRIILRIENRLLIEVWTFYDLKETHPPRELRHVAYEFVAGLNASGGICVPPSKSGNGSIRMAKSVIGFRAKKVEEKTHLTLR